MNQVRRLLFAMLLLSALPVSAESELKTAIYPILFGEPEALETFARTIVADDGHVVLDPRGARLIVVTTAEKHAIIDEVMGKADAEIGNVRIEVRFFETGEIRDMGAGIRGEGDVTIGPGGVDSTLVLRPELRYNVTETRDDTTQIILAASGREAVLRVGESVPYLDWIMDYGWHGGFTTSRVQWQEVGSFLVVTPTILADRQTVHVRITPELRGMVNGEPHRTRFAGLATDVIIQNGQSLSIGGAAEDREFYSRYLIGIDRSGTQRSLDIELTPRIIEASGRPR